MKMKIMKFGGTSVGSPDAIKQMIDIVLGQKNEKPVVVVSAFTKVTDQLIKIGTLAAAQDESYKVLLEELGKRHLDAVKELISVKTQSRVLANVKVPLNELEDVAHGIFLVKELAVSVLDSLMSFGERLSAYIISEAFNDRGQPSDFLDARSVVATDSAFGSARVDFSKTNERIKGYFKDHDALQVVTGFIGSSPEGKTTTLGRGGSDYTASIFGAALEAKVIEIWTDVDGVLTADPRKVKEALLIDKLTYEEAMEMSHFGAKVIHPPTMQPALLKGVPILIKNTFNPVAPGTLISRESSANGHIIRGISSISNITMLRIQGTGLMGVVGISARLFGALARNKISVILITQASSEHSICVAVDPASATAAKQAIDEEFALEIGVHQVDPVFVESDLAIVAVVGESMCHRHGVSGALFRALGDSGVSVVAIAQGSSELNISCVINKRDEGVALNAVHDAFFDPEKKVIHLFLVGTGLIGRTLLKQIDQQKDFLKKERHTEIRVEGLMNSKKMTLGAEPERAANLNDFIAHIQNQHLRNSIFVDCTTSEEVALCYPELLNQGIAVVAPNKKANSGTMEYYRRLHPAGEDPNPRLGANMDSRLRLNRGQFLYETNVGAGLPVINTLSDLLSTGDKVLKIEAVLSGTLSYLFNSFDGSKPFSDLVREAKEKGYTEPDPRDDLNGMDFGRKLLILAREMGWQMELKEVEIESLLSPECQTASSVDDFFEQLKKMDGEFEKRRVEAARGAALRQAQGDSPSRLLRYIGILEKGKAKVSLQAVDERHPFYSLSGSDNIISFTTERYKERPLVVKGPGAGAEVTAAAVFADVLKIV